MTFGLIYIFALSLNVPMEKIAHTHKSHRYCNPRKPSEMVTNVPSLVRTIKCILYANFLFHRCHTSTERVQMELFLIQTVSAEWHVGFVQYSCVNMFCYLSVFLLIVMTLIRVILFKSIILG